jgi:hypothetical protein
LLQSQKQRDGGGLTRPVGSEYGEELTLAHVEVELVQRYDVSKSFGYARKLGQVVVRFHIYEFAARGTTGKVEFD